MASPTLRTDQSLRIYKHGQRLDILSVSEGRGGLRIDQDKAPFVRAHTTLTESISLQRPSQPPRTSPGWHLEPHRPSTPGGMVNLDTPGKAGRIGTPQDPNGGAGGSGGTVGLYVQDLSDTPRLFTPLAPGGDGVTLSRLITYSLAFLCTCCTRRRSNRGSVPPKD
ncbi:hypothetical protein F5I97DRAFT_1418767 [Phlebopus sp. FC_14]|nr:hypothetical protein F5I97DRAFT_1418767 [Phlebopus sp. FC_14]